MVCEYYKILLKTTVEKYYLFSREKAIQKRKDFCNKMQFEVHNLRPSYVQFIITKKQY